MSTQSGSGLDRLSTEQLLALARRHLAGPRVVEIRRSVGSGVVWLVFAAILLTLGSLCLYHFGRAGVAVLFGMGLLLGGLWNLVWGLVWVADRSPVLVLGADALTDNRSLPGCRIAWTNIRRANLARTTRNGAEQSATLTLFLHEAVLGQYQVEISLTDLDCGSHEIFRLIGQRANLE